MRNDGPSPAPNNSQKMIGWPTAPTTRLRWRMKRTHSRETSVPTARNGQAVAHAADGLPDAPPDGAVAESTGDSVASLSMVFLGRARAVF